MDYDVLVIGGGIAGMESALTLGDMGYKVLLVEKEPSIGGKTILLSKVFPTLDCASCISTPKMAATANHPNITTLINTEIERLSPRNGRGFALDLVRKPTFTDLAKCTGCAQCETTCTVAVADEFNADLVARRAAWWGGGAACSPTIKKAGGSLKACWKRFAAARISSCSPTPSLSKNRGT
jgi:heterodisulfide reductase subunit A-like polyferredoxin